MIYGIYICLPVFTQRRKVSSSESKPIDTTWLKNHLQRSFFGCIVTLEELISVTVITSELQVVCRVAEMEEEREDEPDGEDESLYGLSDMYRGLVDASTRIDLISTTECIPNPIADSSRHSQGIKDVVEIVTRDEEMFPVRRKLLRPCIALTSVVQAGRGKYKRNGGNERISIGVEACTFDRVLLYLEHVARGEDFKFDPLIATELLEAAETLGITDLSDRCRKVLGSFEVNVYGAADR